MDVNLAEVVAEVERAFLDYERALAANEVGALVEAFWDSECTVRYGVAERHYGAAAITAWRRAAPGVPAGRRVGPVAIATFGAELACVSAEFRHPGDPRPGRQSQTWVRLAEGWRIVAAHVSVEAG